jgi:endonuclease-3 related protein
MVLTIPHLLRILRKEYGESHWWPGETPFEVMVGAILTQNTAWANVEQAISNLKEGQLLSPEAILLVDRRTLERAIRPSGFYRQKAGYLKALSKYVVDKYGASVDRMRSRSTCELREELLGIPGIGPETADSILLYALGKPSFVVDSYTFRLLDRLGMDPAESYDALKAEFERALQNDAKVYSDAHALIVIHCKSKCKKVPECKSCVLSSMCPSNREQEKEKVSERDRDEQTD